MVGRLIHWAVHNKLVVILLACAIAGVGTYSLLNINIEAYPDPAPAIVEVIAQYPGASAEEVERQLTVPMEVALAGMPGLTATRSKSLFGLAHVRNQFEYGVDINRARTEVLNRLGGVDFPPDVKPELNPASPIGEIYRYYIAGPKDADGKSLYTTADLKSLQDWVLDREFRRVPRIGSVVSFGGEIKRYEVQPDPDRLHKYGISLGVLEQSLQNSNSNAGGDYLMLGETVQAVRGLGLIGGGQDPVRNVLTWDDPTKARDYLRKAEQDRLNGIRQIVLASNNNIPVRVGEIVDGGRAETDAQPAESGVVVGRATRMGRVAVAAPLKNDKGEYVVEDGKRVWITDDDVVEGVALLRKGEQSLPALHDVEAKVKELNEGSGKLLPGVKLVVFNDRTELIDRTTETVKENVFVGLTLVTLILLVFLNDWRCAFIVAINIPLSLLCAFAVLYLTGQSANLLSLGAVDFGIIADSSIIMVECVYRYLGLNHDADLPLEKRIEKAASSIERILFYSTLIMIFALLPLFTMKGPEGQIFGPMANTYAVALGSALLLSITLSPTLCRLFFKNVKAKRENFLVRRLNRTYVRQLKWMLRHRTKVVAGFVAMVVATAVSLNYLGREFMPALEEGNIYVRGTFPVNVSLDEVTAKSKIARELMQKYPEIKGVLSQLGRPDDGTDPTGFYNAELFAPLLPQEEWPLVKDETGWRKYFGTGKRHRTKNELIAEMDADLSRNVPGVDWSFSQAIRDNVLETLSGVKGENSVKIIGNDLTELQQLAEKTKETLAGVPGVENVGIFSIKGQTNLEMFIDPEKCARWNVSTADVQDVVRTAIGGKALTRIVEGERTYDLTLRWPERLRSSAEQILKIPVDVMRNVVKPLGGASGGGNDDLAVSPLGTSLSQPSLAGSAFNSPQAYLDQVPRRRLGDLVSPVDEEGLPDAKGGFVRSAASTIYREQGKRLIAVSFSVRGRDLASAVSEAQAKTSSLYPSHIAVEWSGEFQEMQEAGHRLAIVVSLALLLILVLLYLALHSLLDALVVLTNVLVMCIGGVWALLAAGETFNISAGVGFISILGVGTMSAMLFISRFNMLRAQDYALGEALSVGTEALVRPQCMTALTAILGLLPAALSTKMGSETQRPLAIVVVGGMLMTLLLTNIIPVLYSFYGNRTPPEGAGDMAH
ncbi:MAG: efflux RND transporter permease subunit [Planctomycetaceae bacterium]|nr:efflux RND transporter permease subunit [Planctomycetaceae bacterium]